MTVNELRNYLSSFPASATVKVVVGATSHPFDLGWSGSDGGRKIDASEVAIVVYGTKEQAAG